MKPLTVGAAVAAVLVAALLPEVACSPAFSTAAGGSGGAGSSTSTSTTTGGSSTGTGGATTTTTCPSSCPADEYCNPTTGACESCTTSPRFSFGMPVALPLMLPTVGSSALYPRIDPPTGNLYLVQQGQGTGHLNQLAEALYMPGQMNPWPSAALLSQLMGSHQDSGPFTLQDPTQLGTFAPNAITKLSAPALLFDSDRSGGRHVFGVGYNQATPSQLTLPGNATDESRFVVATDAMTPRFFWISNLGGPTYQLVTSTVASNAAKPVSVTLDTGCVTALADTPWVTPTGDRLLFSSLDYASTGGACAPISSTTTHLYHVGLDATGTPNAKVQRVFPNDDSTDTTPSLSPNRCQLLFSRVSGPTTGLYIASRN
jgi:hypothetical protein